MKKVQHGGKRDGSGRKKSSEGQKPKISVTLSKEVIANLDTAATQLNVSRSEFVERVARGDREALEAIVALTPKVDLNSEIEPHPETTNKKRKKRSLHELRKLIGTDKPAQTRKTSTEE